MQLKGQYPVFGLLIVLAASNGRNAFAAQDDLKSAHSMLQKLLYHRKAATDPSQRRAVADETSSALPEIQRLAVAAITKRLNSSAEPDTSAIQEALRSVFGNAGALKLGNRERPVYVIAFSIPYCADCSTSWLGLFGKRTAEFTLYDSIADSQPNRQLSLFPLGPEHDTTKFVISGLLLGDAHNRLDVNAYAVDKQTLDPIWSRTALPKGEIRVQDGVITLSFASSLRPPSKIVSERYVLLEGNRIVLPGT